MAKTRRDLPLLVVQLDVVDVALLGGRSRNRSASWRATKNEAVIDTLTLYISGVRETPADVVAEIARIHGLLDLAPTDDTELLCRWLAGADPAGNIVLTPAEERAYRRTAERLNGMSALGSGIDQFLY